METNVALLVALVMFVYFTPTIIAIERIHRDTMAILMLNLLLGWTFIGWTAALVWAFLYHLHNRLNRGFSRAELAEIAGDPRGMIRLII